MAAQSTQVIDALVAANEPVRPMRLRTLLLVWILVSVALEFGALIWVGLRPDLNEHLHSVPFVVALAGSSVGALIASWFALREGFPGRGIVSPWRSAWGVGGLLVFAVVLYSGLLWGAPFSTAGDWEDFACCLRMLFGASIPNVLLMGLIARIAPMRSLPAVAYAMLASTFLVTIAGQLNCPISDPRHVIVGHGLLVLAGNGITFGIYTVAFRLLKSVHLRRRWVRAP